MSDSGDDRSDQLVELERAQIGHEIHDALLPLIFAASNGVQAAIERLPPEADQSEQRLQQSLQWLSEALQTGRQLLTEIYPPELIGTLWVRAAQDTISRLFADSATDIVWQTDTDSEQVTRPIAMSAYRIVVEAIRNAIRHGKATQVRITATGRGDGQDGIEVVIVDNGTGFDPEQIPADRFGVRTMQGRAALIGGTLQIDSRKGGPTTILFCSHPQRDGARTH